MDTNINFKYTKYEISKLVENKFKESNLPKKNFCKNFNITEEIFENILIAKISFDKKILNICSTILGKSVNELISQEEDFLNIQNIKDIKDTYEIANCLFNEIIIQDKIYK